jgi:hypothetical protein
LLVGKKSAPWKRIRKNIHPVSSPDRVFRGGDVFLGFPSAREDGNRAPLSYLPHHQLNASSKVILFSLLDHGKMPAACVRMVGWRKTTALASPPLSKRGKPSKTEKTAPFTFTPYKSIGEVRRVKIFANSFPGRNWLDFL